VKITDPTFSQREITRYDSFVSSHSEHPAPPSVAFLEAQRPASSASNDVVDWVVVKPEQDAARLFTLPLLLFVLGSSMVLAAPTHASLAVLGALLITIAPVNGLLRFVRSLQGDAYVAIRKDGLAIRLDVHARERVFAWDSIDDVTYCESEGKVFVHVQGAEEVVLRGPFELSVRDLTVRIRNARRLAVWNRLSRGALEPWC
jgi:hypothetical protein